MNSFLLFFLFLHLLINVKKFYRCVRGIVKYKTNDYYFIPGKIYKCAEDIVEEDKIFLIDELGEDHYVPSSIFETHFKPLISNKRHRNDKGRR